MSEGAVSLDSTLFASHVLLGLLSNGKRKEYHRRMAKKYVGNENETSKLFESLLEVKDDSSRGQRRKLRAGMHELSNDPFIYYEWIRYMDQKEDTLAILSELDKLITFCEENEFRDTETAALNMKGYLLKRTGELQEGTKAIEMCLRTHPEGYNPVDSRAEFYLYAGDTVDSIKWYKKVLEKYPYAQTALRQLQVLREKD